jgi:hypothetical protein
MSMLRLGRRSSQTARFHALHLSQMESLQALYLQDGSEPSDDDHCIGVVASPALAKIIVESVNDNEAFRRLVRIG